MTKHRHDWSYVQQRIRDRMKELGYYTNTAFEEASHLSTPVVADFTTSKNPRATNNRRGDTIPKLCDALHWQHDAIDRLLAGQEPLEAEPNHGADVVSIAPIDQIAERVADLEMELETALEFGPQLAARLDELTRRLEQLEGEVRRRPGDRRQSSSDG